MNKETSTQELCTMIVDAVCEERYINKETLSPKIRAIIVGFRLNLNTINYHKKEKPSETARLIRSNQLINAENHFWKQQIEAIVGKEEMKLYYAKLDEFRKQYQNELVQNTDNTTENKS